MDLLEGTNICSAESKDEFDHLCKSEENQNRWFMADWVAICHESGLIPSETQCLGWKVHPILGGKFEFANIQLSDLAVYECVVGQLLRQIHCHRIDFEAIRMKSDGSEFIRCSVECYW